MINGEDLGEVEVLASDSDGSLTSALNNIDGLTATMSSDEITVEWSGQLVVSGVDPTGGGCLTNLMSGTYE